MIKSLKDKIYSKAGIESQRTKNITKHVLLSFLYKGGSIIANFLLVPLTINYLDTENYGVWLTLSSFIAWFSFFDIGLGNGLRNKFVEAKAQGDLLRARAYVSSAYYTIGAVCVTLIVLFVGLNFVIDWTKVFNTKPELYNDLRLLMPIVFGFFCLQLVAKLITTIYTADQHHSMQGKINFFTQAGSLLLIWLMTFTNKSSLLIFGIIFSVFPLLILIGLNLFAFYNQYKIFKPTLALWRKDYLIEIFGLSFRFFIIQISGIIIFSTDSFIITNMLGPAEVVPYQVAFKYFSISAMVYSIICTPYWSGFTEAYVNKDKLWIENAIKTLVKYAIFFSFGSLILLILSKWVYQIWLGEKIHIDWMLSALMAAYFIQNLISTPFTIYINGTGKVLLQTWQGVISAIINVPLSIFFVKYCHMGSSGVILGTIISLIPTLILAPLQTWKLTKETANNLFNR